MDCPEPEAKRGGDKAEVACPCPCPCPPDDDSLVEILSRLPAKPLFRFKCVSKDWCGLITDRLRCRKLPQALEGFLAGQGAKNYGGFIDLSERPVPLVDPSSFFSFLTKLPGFENVVLFGSCNGLVLFGRRHARGSERCDSLDYVVCNPATEEWVAVPSSGYTPWERGLSDEEDYLSDGPADTYLIFDPAISPHFQLIQLVYGRFFELDKVRTFSSTTGAWRLELKEGTGVPHHMMMIGTGVCVFNGVLHVCANSHPFLTPKKHMTVAVGVEGRPFRALDWPGNDRGSIVFFGQSQGLLHCLSGHMTEVEMTELSIWVLEDYNAEKWVLRDNVSISQLFKRARGCSIKDWKVVGIHPDRGLIFFAEYWNHKLISYDMDKKEVHALCSLHGYHRPIIPYVPYFAQSVALSRKN